MRRVYPVPLLHRITAWLRRIRHALLRRVASSYADPTVLPWRWRSTPHDRRDVIQRIVRSVRAHSYLEIGCDEDHVFAAVDVPAKVGVDPVRGGTHRMTSDKFFATSQASFDVVFVDGDHRYAQVRRDVTNALTRLPVGGYIVLHDMLPTTWQEAHVPRVQETWVGDVWRLAFDLATAPGITFEIVLIDHGVGIIEKTDRRAHLPPEAPGRDLRRFRSFAKRFHELPLVAWDAWGERLPQR